MQTFNPPIKPYATHQVATPDGHNIYVLESGSPDGLPVLVCHDGPGLGSLPHSRCYFDPEVYRIIQFDQRGSGRSKPHLDIASNTMPALLADMEVLRKYFALERLVVSGGGFGAKVALAYAIQHHQVLAGVLLWSISLPGAQEISWRYQAGGGANKVFPDLFKNFQDYIPKSEQNDLVAAYYKRLTGDDDIIRMQAAKAWYTWVHGCSAFYSSEATAHHTPDSLQCLNVATLSAHYVKNGYFFGKTDWLKQAQVLQSLPGFVVQGRYDLLSPLVNAWELCEQWPGAQLTIVREAGHSELEPPMVAAIVYAAKELASIILA